MSKTNKHAHIPLLSKMNQQLATVLEYLVISLVALLLMDVSWGVFSRFVLGAQSAWTEELARFLLVWLALLGASVAFRQHKHLGIDLFTQQLESTAKAVSDMLVSALIIVFAGSVFIYGGAKLVSNALAMQQELIALPISKAWFYAALPLSGFFICSFSLEQLCLIKQQYKSSKHHDKTKSKSV
ncbi:TRAP transporter small permease [Agaribacterium sp. ZY112]|uniref:TRAP transporter small permease n=1 Tax=Agaribacterium sp. ZY112 TaxID=3233574 RepID=UPI00352689C2